MFQFFCRYEFCFLDIAVNAIDDVIPAVDIENANIPGLHYSYGEKPLALYLFSIRIIEMAIPLEFEDNVIELVFDIFALFTKEVLYSAKQNKVLPFAIVFERILPAKS